MKKFLEILLITTMLLFFSLSCREEVIEPNIFVENVNDPVQLNERNSYTFLLNANSFSMDLTVFPFINSSRSRISVTLIDYQAGYAKLTIQDYDNRERYTYFAAEDISLYTDIIDGYIPESVIIRTEDFSGKIKIELRKSL
ncbi:MAG: hypothetical protein KJN64_05770 [Ignavibacteria bacterium]|nr:hypothetical protein [Ignavibacteria bacterium]MBT8383738.1 hypothetical protein [Ignavibacteria bacterium]NNL19870.1 hypothetical protein [Ignavibacteriaceae bacterium]